MELVYLWVEAYKNIHKQGFNFSPKFNCNYNPDTNELTIDENDDYIENFFGDNINVTAIVGKNGSGKSSVLEVLVQILIKHNNFKYFYILNNGVNNKCYSNDINVQTNIDKKYYIPTRYTSSKIIDGNQEYVRLSEYINMSYLNISHLERDYLIKNDAIEYETPLNYLGIYAKNDFERSTDTSIFPTFSEFNLDRFNFLQTYTIGYLLTEEKYSKFLFNVFKIEKPQKLQIKYDKNKLKKIKAGNTRTRSNSDAAIDETVPAKIDAVLNFLEDNSLVEIGSDEYKNFFSLGSSVFNLETNFKLTFVTNDGKKIKFSSGETTVLFYLNKIDDMLIKLKKEPKYTILLWDEIELYLHPMWQKKILKIIIDFIKIEKLEKLLHIIVSSHSPFLLSDIPKQNIIFLDTYRENDKEVLEGKQKVGNCKVVNGLKEKKQTFGANIHTLLSDSFFMEDGLMGEFAKGKIQQIMNLLNGKPSSYDYKFRYIFTNVYHFDLMSKNIKKVIDAIGEPFLRDKLLKMHEEKYPQTNEEKIKDLEAEIERIRSGKNQLQS